MIVSRAVRFLALGMFAVSLCAARTALAQDDWKEDGDKAPPDEHKKKEAPPPADDTGPPPRVLLELKIGPAFILASKAAATRGATEFGLQINAGYALAHDAVTKGDAFYLTLSPYLVVGSDLTLVAPLGVQYDLPLKMIAYKGLYAYARTSVGYAFYQPPLNKIENGVHAFAVQPAIGARLTFAERFHVGLEPFGIDVIHTFPPKATTNTEDTLVAFQLSIFGGARF